MERKSKIIINLTKCDKELPIIGKFSSFRKLQLVIAYCFRFTTRDKKIRNSSALMTKKLNYSMVAIIRHVQMREYPQEFVRLKTNNQSECKKLTKLNPFLDDNQVLRVGGRIKKAPIGYNNKFPIILPDKHHLTTNIIRMVHENELHAGPKANLAAGRQRFSPLGARISVRKIIHSCSKCARVNLKLIVPKMAIFQFIGYNNRYAPSIYQVMITQSRF